jgi:hypothetical protein
VEEEARNEEETPGQQGDEAEMMARLEEEIRNLSVSDHLFYMMHSLSALAVGRMGLSTDTLARRDLEQARLAIDAFKALLGTVEPVRPASEVAAHRGMLSQLQLAYVGALDMDAPPESGERGEEPGPAAEQADQA